MSGAPIADLQAETAVLGAMASSQAAIVEALQLLRGEDFYRGAHQILFDALVRLHGEGVKADIVTLHDELVRTGQLENVGGLETLTAMLDMPWAPASCGHYARIVAERAARRRVVAGAARILASAQDLTDDFGETLAAQLAELTAAPSSRRLRCLTLDELAQLPKPEFLVDGLVQRGLGVLWGASGGGKSFLAIDWACSAAAGVKWLGRPVRRSPVVYVAAEGADGVQARVEAWTEDRRAKPIGFHLVPDVVSLRDAGDVASLSQMVAEKRAGLLVIDTWARCIGGDENKTSEVGEAIRNLDRIRLDRGCAVLVVHHNGVTDPDRMRGNGSLYNAADSVVAVEAEGSVVTLTNEPKKGKQKNGEPDRQWHLFLKQVGPSAVLTVSTLHREGLSKSDIVAKLAENGPATRMELAKFAGGDMQAADRLIDSGAVVAVEQGEWFDGATTYVPAGAEPAQAVIL